MVRTRVLEKKGTIYDPITWHQISDECCPNAQNTPESLSVLSDNMGALDLVVIQGDQAVVSAALVGLQSKQKRKDNKQTRGVERTICHQPQKQICLGRTAGWGRRWRR